MFKAARSSNGRTADSESVNLGSSPSLAALNGKLDFESRSPSLAASLR